MTVEQLRAHLETVLRERYVLVSLGEATDGPSFSATFAQIGAAALVESEPIRALLAEHEAAQADDLLEQIAQDWDTITIQCFDLKELARDDGAPFLRDYQIRIEVTRPSYQQNYYGASLVAALRAALDGHRSQPKETS